MVVEDYGGTEGCASRSMLCRPAHSREGEDDLEAQESGARHHDWRDPAVCDDVRYALNVGPKTASGAGYKNRNR